MGIHQSVISQDVGSLVDYVGPEDEHLASDYIQPSAPKTRLFSFEQECCGKGWSSGICSGFMPLLLCQLLSRLRFKGETESYLCTPVLISPHELLTLSTVTANRKQHV